MAAVVKCIINTGPKSLSADVSSSKAQLIVKKLNYRTLSKYNRINKRKIYYNDSRSSRSRSAVVMRLASSVPETNNITAVDIIPRPVTVSFGRSLWAEDVFESKLDHEAQEDYTQDIELLKGRVRKMLVDNKNYTARDKLVLIDTLERFDIAYHFDNEIEDQIKRISDRYLKLDHKERDEIDLFTTALYFRMLRHHGYNVSCSVFDKFKDEDSKFKKTLCGDIEGLLSLYEASFLRFHEETELQEARDFATHHLNKSDVLLQDPSSSYLKEKVNRALEQPLHWALPKVEARYYISIYEKKESKDDTLLRLAKLDFRVMQNMYKKEMHELQKWWYSFDLVSKLPYARDSVVPSYFWASALSYEPKYSRSRIDAAKVVVIGTLYNDTYDSYATLEEVQTLTDITQRLDTRDIDELPDYMKIVYDALLHVLHEYEHETSEQGKSYMDAHFKEIIREMASAYLKKVKWYKGKERPMFQDHVDSMGITSGIHQMLAAFCIHVESSSKAAFDWLASNPSSVKSGAWYCRYLNDISSYQREHESGLYPTSVDCYMEENGVSMQEAREKFAELAEDCWMTLNKEWIEMNDDISGKKELLKAVINYARGMFACYGHGLDCFSCPEKGLDASINALLVDPILI